MFNQRKNKRFSYKPRFQDSEEVKSKGNLEHKWSEIKGNTKRRGSRLFSLPALIIMLIALFVLMYILDGYIK
ncbi:hypothetical protein [Winogradskyella sp.]|uniref:hypothetical protein n=1 Tax=Winogradskyella sp. TaxID=1883156 RepID=UPI0026080C78|nr:hypothetical protein [Winogradskyella sp.]